MCRVETWQEGGCLSHRANAEASHGGHTTTELRPAVCQSWSTPRATGQWLCPRLRLYEDCEVRQRINANGVSLEIEDFETLSPAASGRAAAGSRLGVDQQTAGRLPGRTPSSLTSFHCSRARQLGSIRALALSTTGGRSAREQSSLCGRQPGRSLLLLTVTVIQAMETEGTPRTSIKALQESSGHGLDSCCLRHLPAGCDQFQFRLHAQAYQMPSCASATDLHGTPWRSEAAKSPPYGRLVPPSG